MVDSSYGARLDSNGTIVVTQARSNNYEQAVDMLRNEEPIRIHFNSTQNIFVLHTGTYEPVGENE